MECHYLDQVPWGDSQSLYHAAAYLGREALMIMRPAEPYVCLGFHQDAEHEIDLDFARQAGIPLIRREVGGGAVYLDSGQLFYQLILRKGRPGLPANKGDLYRALLGPVIATYRQFGVQAEFRPVNDIVANQRKVSGNGAAEIEGMLVLVGNFILDFDYRAMSRILKVPDEKFRHRLYKTLSESLSSFRRETGSVPATANLAAALIPRYESLLGAFEIKTEIDAPLRLKADERLAEMISPPWLFANDRRRVHPRQVKIREGVHVLERAVKLPGGLVRATVVERDGCLSSVHISGDFFIYPRDALLALERALEGAPMDKPGLASVIQRVYREHGVEAPGITPQALAGVLVS